MNVIVAFLGLFSLWQIAYFGFVMYKHYLLFIAGIENSKNGNYRRHWAEYAPREESP